MLVEDIERDQDDKDSYYICAKPQKQEHICMNATYVPSDEHVVLMCIMKKLSMHMYTYLTSVV